MFVAVFALVAHLLPVPASVEPIACPGGRAEVPLRIAAGTDTATIAELNERWSALGIGTVRVSGAPQLRFVTDRSIASQGYRLEVNGAGVRIASADAAGAFYGAMTLAQLPARVAGRWSLPCVDVRDHPALRWRVLSDDVSRGPIPSMRYFEERIRTIAAFKMNGYSPYMEHVFASPTDPLPAPADGITPAQLRELARYAARFHVTLIPEQQTFAHMHNTLRVEEYASAAALPHGFLLAPDSPLAAAYLARIIGQEKAAVGPVPFFHIGSDETATLEEGATTAYVASHGGRSAVYAAHVRAMAALVAPARAMVWDDGIEDDPSIMQHIPRDAVIVNWHYDARDSFLPFIRTIAGGGFEQMVAPGANNWSEIFPDLTVAIPNEQRFIREGAQSHVLGLFQTVWHDDGETLNEATWYPVLFAASESWNPATSDDAFAAAFAPAFFGSNDVRFSEDERVLGALDARLGGATDRLFWCDPFDAVPAAHAQKADLTAVRLSAERVATHLLSAKPPLHVNAARVMLLAAQRYDALGRRYQIAREVRDYYADAGTHPNDAIRDLFWCRYWFWEQRDTDEALALAYARVWRYENREGHLASNLERYHLDAQTSIRRADAIDRVIYDDYVPSKNLPALDAVLR